MALMRHAMERELAGETDGSEQRIAATLARMQQDQERLLQIQQTFSPSSTRWRRRCSRLCPSKAPSPSPGPKSAMNGS